MGKDRQPKNWPEPGSGVLHLNSYDVRDGELFVEASNGTKEFYPERRFKNGLGNVMFRNNPDGIQPDLITAGVGEEIKKHLQNGEKICMKELHKRLYSIFEKSANTEQIFSGDDFTKDMIVGFFSLTSSEIQVWRAKNKVPVIYEKKSGRFGVWIETRNLKNGSINIVLRIKPINNDADYLHFAQEVMGFSFKA